jgi:hypothetical protein
MVAAARAALPRAADSSAMTVYARGGIQATQPSRNGSTFLEGHDMQTWRCSTVDVALLLILVAITLGATGFLAYVAADPPADSIYILSLIFTPVFLGLSLMVGLVAWVFAFTRIAIGDRGLQMRVPTWHGSFPTPPMREFAIPFGGLRLVQSRVELRRSMGVPTVAAALLVQTAAGERILVNRNTNPTYGMLPIEEIAAAIGRAMKCPVDEHGMIDVAASPTGDGTQWDAPVLDRAQAEHARRRSAKWVKILAGFVAAAFAGRACAHSFHSHVRCFQMQANKSVACMQALVSGSSGQGRRRGR